MIMFISHLNAVLAARVSLFGAGDEKGSFPVSQAVSQPVSQVGLLPIVFWRSVFLLFTFFAPKLFIIRWSSMTSGNINPSREDRKKKKTLIYFNFETFFTFLAE